MSRGCLPTPEETTSQPDAGHVPADRMAGQVCGEPLAQMPCFISIDRANIVLRLRVFALIS